MSETNQINSLNNSSWFVFDKIYENISDFQPNTDGIMLGRYIYCTGNKGIYRKEYNDDGFEYCLIVHLIVTENGVVTETNGEIYNDYEYNEARTPYSSARGSQTIAGGKGFRIISIETDPNTRKVIAYELSSSNNIEINDVYSVRIGNNYDNIGKIIGIKGTKVLVDVGTQGTSTNLTNAFLWLPPQPNDSNEDRMRKINCGDVFMDACQSSEGYGTYAINYASHAEGYGTTASGRYSHAEGNHTYAGWSGHSEGNKSQAIGNSSHAEGTETQGIGTNSHAEGHKTQALGLGSHAEGLETKANGNYSHTEGQETKAESVNAHAEGYKTIAKGLNAHAEGQSAQAQGENSHAEGQNTIASGKASHAEGQDAQATANNAHAEGYNTKATAIAAHSENHSTEASGNYSHAGGFSSKVIGTSSFAHGHNSVASGGYGAVFGEETKTNVNYQFAIGRKNSTECSKGGTSGAYPILMVGDSSDEEKNAFTVFRDGTARIGKAPVDDMDVANKSYVNDQISALGTVLNYKGSVETYDNLNYILNPLPGEVYNVIDTNMNYAYTTNGWDQFGATTDLSGYMPLTGGTITNENYEYATITINPGLFKIDYMIFGPNSFVQMGADKEIGRDTLAVPKCSGYIKLSNSECSNAIEDIEIPSSTFEITAIGVKGNDIAKESWQNWLEIDTLKQRIEKLENSTTWKTF